MASLPDQTLLARRGWRADVVADAYAVVKVRAARWCMRH